MAWLTLDAIAVRGWPAVGPRHVPGMPRTSWVPMAVMMLHAQISTQSLIDENEALKARVADLESQLVATRQQDSTSVLVEPLRTTAPLETMSLATIIAHSRASVVYHVPQLTAKVRTAVPSELTIAFLAPCRCAFRPARPAANVLH